MKFMVECPVHSEHDGGAWIDPDNILRFARTVEEAGLHGIALTEHPAPSKKWLSSGGHETHDPFVGLAYMAAVTERVNLFTWLAVVPYRNPLLTAKTMTTLDIVSKGRAVFVLGTGYLRSVFGALGVDFTERNELFDEAIEVLQGIWSTDEFSYEGRHFTARGQIVKPAPVSTPHPPLWIGGNATIVRNRVASWAQGWSPLMGPAVLSTTTRTPPVSNNDELLAMMADLAGRLEANGRSLADIDVMSASYQISPEHWIDEIGQLGEAGVTWTVLPLDIRSVEGALDQVRRFGEEVVAKHR